MQNLDYLYSADNETAGVLVPAQIIYDAFHGRYHNSTGAVIFLFIIWGSFFFCGLSVTTTAARVVRKTETLDPKQYLSFTEAFNLKCFYC